MNPELIHDALTLLPADLIQQTDALRAHPKKAPVRWMPIVSLAACLVLVLGCSITLSQIDSKSASRAVPAEAPMMQAAPAAPAEDTVEEVAAEEAGPEEYQDTNTTVTGTHAHRFAESKETSGTGSTSYCGNTAVTVYTADGSFTISGRDAIVITDILIHLNYDPAQVCDCETTLSVDTETLPGIALSLEEGFARCEKGQAALSAEQAAAIGKIVGSLS